MPSIRVESVSKRFRRYSKDQPATLQETFLRGWRHRAQPNEFWALQDVSLEVAAGEMVGVIGRNGAGKSSLLRLVGGIGEPDKGRVVVDGRLGALIDLGAGFHPELTGRENVYMNGVISGFTRRQIDTLMDEIVAFAELESFIDSPVRTYSSGMQLRLAFSVAVHVRPEVLLVDEVLAVGDLAFQRKCLQRIDLLRSEGAAILFVTHDLVQAQKACSQVAWLDKGHVAAWGPAAEVVEIYRQTMQGRLGSGSADASAQPALAGELLRYNENRFGTLALELSKVQLTDGAGVATQAIETGRPLSVEMQWCAAKPLGDVVFTVAVRAIDGLVLCEAHSTAGKLPSLQGKLALCIDRLDLAAGAYYVDVGAYTSDYEVTYDYHWGAYPLQVQGLGDGRGPMRPPLHWEMTGG